MDSEMESHKRRLEDLDISPSKRMKHSLPATPESLPLSPSASTPKDPRPLLYHCSFASCTASFTRPCRLAEHERSHTGERPFVCPQCPKSFARDYHLSRHLTLSHTDQRDYACGWHGCAKAFATAQRRNEHEKTHSRNKEFSCTGYDPCDAVFRKKSTLAVHIKKVHLQLKPFPCDHFDLSTNLPCTAAYESAGKLREHLRRCHSSLPRFYCSMCSIDSAEEDHGQFLSFNSLHLLLAHKRLLHPPASNSRRRPMPVR